eukprot:TRINITY_DN8620_c0_g1_i4.p1 TRINITY_DN8620_c0_g1~~TRINITY_DN8620_c0_g1_i4.p1  ORF type:complete len:623 (-),score=99.46 TRINITY_DN8620_c0_g1_i4:282-2150(-)
MQSPRVRLNATANISSPRPSTISNATSPTETTKGVQCTNCHRQIPTERIVIHQRTCKSKAPPKPPVSIKTAAGQDEITSSTKPIHASGDQISADTKANTGALSQCSKCGRSIFTHRLADHVKLCKGNGMSSKLRQSRSESEIKMMSRKSTIDTSTPRADSSRKIVQEHPHKLAEKESSAPTLQSITPRATYSMDEGTDEAPTKKLSPQEFETRVKTHTADLQAKLDSIQTSLMALTPRKPYNDLNRSTESGSIPSTPRLNTTANSSPHSVLPPNLASIREDIGRLRSSRSWSTSFAERHSSPRTTSLNSPLSSNSVLASLQDELSILEKTAPLPAIPEPHERVDDTGDSFDIFQPRNASLYEVPKNRRPLSMSDLDTSKIFTRLNQSPNLTSQTHSQGQHLPKSHQYELSEASQSILSDTFNKEPRWQDSIINDFPDRDDVKSSSSSDISFDATKPLSGISLDRFRHKSSVGENDAQILPVKPGFRAARVGEASIPLLPLGSLERDDTDYRPRSARSVTGPDSHRGQESSADLNVSNFHQSMPILTPRDLESKGSHQQVPMLSIQPRGVIVYSNSFHDDNIVGEVIISLGVTVGNVRQMIIEVSAALLVFKTAMMNGIAVVR